MIENQLKKYGNTPDRQLPRSVTRYITIFLACHLLSSGVLGPVSVCFPSLIPKTAMGEILDSSRFLFFERLFTTMSWGMVLGMLLLILWGYHRGFRHLLLLTLMGGIISAQIMTYTQLEFCPRYSIGLSLIRCREQTEYAPGFTREAFAQLHIGMSREDVKHAIGQGLAPFSQQIMPAYNAPVWYYSRPRGGCEDYWYYTVTFQDNRVSSLKMIYWRD